MIFLSRKASNLVLVLLFLELKEILFSTAVFSYSQSISAIPLPSTPELGYAVAPRGIGERPFSSSRLDDSLWQQRKNWCPISLFRKKWDSNPWYKKIVR